MKQVIKNIISSFPSYRSPLVWAYTFLIGLLMITLLHRFVANDVPIVGMFDGEMVFPVFRDIGNDVGLLSFKDRYKYRMDEGNYSFMIPTPIPYNSTNIDDANAGFVSPFEKQKVSTLYRRHWLGTDQLGRDTLAGLIAGSRVSILVGFFTCLLALFIGIPLGLIAGYYGNDGLKFSWISICIGLISIAGIFYLLSYYHGVLTIALIWLLVTCGCIFIIEKNNFGNRQWTIPVDSLVMRGIEIFKSIPALIIIFVFLAVLSSESMWNIVLVLGIVIWFNIARYIRGELLNIRRQDYVSAQRSIGQNDLVIMIKHCLKIALPPVIVSVVFLFASVILMESTLSFLGIGLPQEAVSWGSMLRDGRNYFPAWWMALFPGLGILLSVMSLHVIAHHWIKRIDPKNL